MIVTMQDGKQVQEKRKTSGPPGWQLVAVQSISCAVIVLIALIFKLIGGSAFSQLRQSFNASIMSNSFIATLASLLDEPGTGLPDDGASGKATTAGTAGDTTGGTSATENGEDGTSETQTGETTGSTGNTNSTNSASGATTQAAGGQDLTVNGKKVLYAPEGASFAALEIDRIAALPVSDGHVTSYFGYREHPINGGDSFHQGLDIAAEKNTPISALYYGVVTETGTGPSYGNYIKIYHGSGVEVTYAHCEQILAGKDAVVRAGETVALVGSTGNSTGNHVHVEIKKNGVAYDPAAVIPLEQYA